ncbi:MAG: chemotaxis response regulator protein-glutamate methylesterase [Alphaproteobacteria bacterium]|nr:chemotaxis response regulator protein-glutamate methylesterase [Alphaproteobacteria bacterium]MBV8548304.1 chemotaxis response regulator protein-glutamate methylesterase [Alphaproteobacteria bacterium]
MSTACRAIVVDDSAVIRGLIARALRGRPEITVVGTASNGQNAVDLLKREPADVIILDIEMPIMDGLTAIPLLKQVDPAAQIIMASTLTHKNAEISLKALSLGATDYLPKPTSDRELIDDSSNSFNHDLIEKVVELSKIARNKGVRSASTQKTATIQHVAAPTKRNIVLRPMPHISPDIVAIGTSTGGPQALFEVIRAVGATPGVPVVITQHMPPSFTAILADHIANQCNVKCEEAKDGMPVVANHYYLAPGDYHMTLSRVAGQVTISLNKEPPENFCRPSVDPMLRSLVPIYGRNILTVILTGMGQDGLKGSEQVIAAGGAVIAQDEATSVVWGMPGAVAMAGVCSGVYPLNEIGHVTRQVATRGAR